MYEKLRLFALLPAMLLVLAHLILVQLRVDHSIEISWYLVATPAIVALGLGGLTYLVLATGLLPGVKTHDRMLAAGISVLLLGALWPVIVLARRFEADSLMSYLGAFLPLELAIFIATGFAAGSLAGRMVHDYWQKRH